ncbi:phage baseplate assembly protein V [Pseudoalteromonas sp. Of7M-16]|uniref:phage baseplate assembly protein V n=1 Tax=Pseudoalteromonas sp. Of7M-16 TaxID=2917756 RepID=UPI001EF59875|nr:phage baseplate assembly protein V [Pseudoalteromonas sp. Of7M-16]MCG7551569.1 phage baseplate assembly protein V [Pseudoalteromonas sp. Of7M-16]
MRQLIEQIMREMLNPYLERIEGLSSEVEELRRRTQSMIRLGRVVEVEESGWLIKVEHGDLITPFIRWFSGAAGEVKEYRCPSIDEQCVLLNFGAGNNGTQTVALIGLFSDRYPSPCFDPNEILRVYPDGTKVSYNMEAHKLDIVIEGEASLKIAESATVDIGGNAMVKAGGEIKVDGSKVQLNGGSPCVTTAHICHFTGTPHGDGSSTVTAGK